MKYIYVIVIIISLTSNVYSEELLSKIIKENTSTFTYQNGKFEGEGWVEISNEIKENNNVLIGEDHFFNEIPLFVSEIVKQERFDNFFCEIDPHSAKIIEQKIKELNDDQFKEYTNNLNDFSFSFYSLSPEFNLLREVSKSETNILGTDQIVLMADQLMALKLIEITKSAEAKELYNDIRKSSYEHLELFKKGKGQPYFLTDSFKEKLNKIQTLTLSPEENDLIEDLKLSRKIYINQDHHLRIQLMKNNIIKNVEAIKEQKNLFKYGAIHVNKGESILGGYDIGNLIHNISDSNFKSSLHIMILGKSGTQSIPLNDSDVHKVDPTSNELKAYSPFFDNTNGNEWHLFNTKNILKSVNKNNIVIEDKVFLKTLKGFDYFIVIPEGTAAQRFK